MTVVKMYVLLLLGFDLLVSRTDGEKLCSCYTFSNSSGNWKQANQSCEKSNKTLVVMETEEEWQFVTKEIQDQTGGSPEDEWLIGLKQNPTTGNWTWINGKPLTIHKWRCNKPSSDECYGLIDKEFPGGGVKGSLSTIKLTTIRGWICEEERATCQGICFHHPVPINTSPRGTSAATKTVTAQGSSTTISTPTTVKSTNNVLTDDKSSSSTTIMIVAASLGAVLFVALIILIAVMLLRRKKRQGEDAESAPPKNHSPKILALKNSEKDQLGESKYESVNPVEAAKLLGSANRTSDKSKERIEASSENCEYAVVNKANKKRKEGDLVYAQLAEFDNETDAAKPPKPPSYEPTIYADVEELSPELPEREVPDSPQPTYTNLETTGV